MIGSFATHAVEPIYTEKRYSFVMFYNTAYSFKQAISLWITINPNKFLCEICFYQDTFKRNLKSMFVNHMFVKNLNMKYIVFCYHNIKNICLTTL